MGGRNLLESRGKNLGDRRPCAAEFRVQPGSGRRKDRHGQAWAGARAAGSCLHERVEPKWARVRTAYSVMEHEDGKDGEKSPKQVVR